MLFYCPLEAYAERYTYQLSAPIIGWVERALRLHDVDYYRVEVAPHELRGIATGQVLDASGRPRHAMQQSIRLLDLMEMKQIGRGDTIFFDDFFHPGIEGIAYACWQRGWKPAMYAFLYAQSVDEFDFTYPMRRWMRHIEKGYGEILDGIFVANTLLKDLVVQAGIAPADKVHVVGLIFDSAEVLKWMPSGYRDSMDVNLPPVAWERENQVVFSSRWDEEKNPDFFLRVATKVLRLRRDVRFVICTGASELRSNNEHLIDLLHEMIARRPDNITIKQGLTKKGYYETLCRSKVQFNCASQDWVSFTLLEATVAGCYPIYPYFRSFPETLRQKAQYLYCHQDEDDAARMIVSVLDGLHHWHSGNIQSRSWIYKRYDETMSRILTYMNLGGGTPDGFKLNPYA